MFSFVLLTVASLPPQAPPLEDRVKILEAKLADVESRLGMYPYGGLGPLPKTTPPPAKVEAKPAPAPQTQNVMQAFIEAVPVQQCGRRGCYTTMEYRTVYRPVQQTVQPAPVPETKTEIEIKEKKNKTVIKTRTTTAALDQLNFQRAQRGLYPYRFDEGLTRAAEKCASIKAASCLSGHLQGPMSDFACLEPGVHAASAGADGSKIHASDPNFYTCAMYDGYTYAGAAQFVGPDGNKYMSLFVR